MHKYWTPPCTSTTVLEGPCPANGRKVEKQTNQVSLKPRLVWWSARANLWSTPRYYFLYSLNISHCRLEHGAVLMSSIVSTLKYYQWWPNRFCPFSLLCQLVQLGLYLKDEKSTLFGHAVSSSPWILVILIVLILLTCSALSFQPIWLIIIFFFLPFCFIVCSFFRSSSSLCLLFLLNLVRLLFYFTCELKFNLLSRRICWSNRITRQLKEHV